MSKTKRTKLTATLDQEIGNRLRLRRRELGLTQRDLAAALGMTFQQIQKYETGASTISAPTLVRAAEFLGAQPAVFLPSVSHAVRPSPTINDDDQEEAADLLRARSKIEDDQLKDLLLTVAQFLASQSRRQARARRPKRAARPSGVRRTGR